jgi:hypothetical protein
MVWGRLGLLIHDWCMLRWMKCCEPGARCKRRPLLAATAATKHADLLQECVSGPVFHLQQCNTSFNGYLSVQRLRLRCMGEKSFPCWQLQPGRPMYTASRNRMFNRNLTFTYDASCAGSSATLCCHETGAVHSVVFVGTLRTDALRYVHHERAIRHVAGPCIIRSVK